MPDSPKSIRCAQCQQLNPPDATRCTNCQAPLPRTASPGPTIAPKKSGGFRSVIDGIKRWLFGVPQPTPGNVSTAQSGTMRRRANQKTMPAQLSKNQANGEPLPDEPSLPTPIPEGQNIAGQYRNLKTVRLETCTYYEAIALNDLRQDAPPPPPTYLIRETGKRPLPLTPEVFQTLTNNGQIPAALPYQYLYPTRGRIYTFLPHPGPWGLLSKLKTPQPPDKAIAWSEQVARALHALNQLGYGGFWPGQEGRESIILIQGEAFLADLSFARPVEEQNFADDVYALASLLHYLLTGQEITPDAAQAPPQFRALLRHAASRAIQTIPAFLQELELSKQESVYQRALRQTCGYLTHVGRARKNNEDYVGVFQLGLDQAGSAPPVGLYVVADGMGGQSAGEFASEGSVRHAFVRFINEQVLPDLQRSTRRLDEATAVTPQQQLENLVQVANQIVYQANQKARTDRGSTMTAALIIGDKATIANVGDSRTYLLREGQLRQVTQDHSLVYSLYLAGQISEEEIYTHPRKNEIHRSIGDKATVQVDLFSHQLQAGDKLLLCSDGLWEMVRNPSIKQLLASSATPQMICDQLIRLANENGGEDNISAIVIVME